MITKVMVHNCPARPQGTPMDRSITGGSGQPATFTMSHTIIIFYWSRGRKNEQQNIRLDAKKQVIWVQ